MPGLEIRIPYVSYKTKTKGFPHRVNVSTTDVTIQENLQYMGTSIQMSPSKQPLNTLNDDLQWSIVDGSTYANIDASSGELTIKEGTITQMVKVRAQSRLNVSVFDEKEVVLTYKEQPVIEELNYDISISGLFQKMIFVSTDTIYSVAAELVPTTTDEYVVFDITEGADKVVIQDVSLINGKTNFTFSFAEPVEEITDIVFRFYHKDNYDIRKDIAVELHNKVRSIMFRNVDAGPYISDRKYKFDYYTDPVLTQRKLDVSLIQGSQYINQWYDTSVNGTSGTINFVRNNNDVGQGQTVIFKVSDVSTDTSNNISFEFGQIPVHRIDVYGNKNEYINDISNYYSFKWEEVPNEYQRELNVSVYDPDNCITYNTSDVSFGKGTFNFKSTSLSTEGWVLVRIYDPNNTLFHHDVEFRVKNPVRVENTFSFSTVQGYSNDIQWAKENDRFFYGMQENGLKLINYPGEVRINSNNMVEAGRPANNYYCTLYNNDIINIELNLDISHLFIYVPNTFDGYYINTKFYSVLTNERLSRPISVSKTVTTNTEQAFPGIFQDNGLRLRYFYYSKGLIVESQTADGNKISQLYSDFYRIKLQDYDAEEENQITYVYLQPDEQNVIDFFTARNTKEIVYRGVNGVWSGQDVVDYFNAYGTPNDSLSKLTAFGGAPYTMNLIIKYTGDYYMPAAGTYIDNVVQVGDIYNINYDIKAGDNYEMEYKVNIKINVT